MAEATLVEPKIKAGAELLQALDDELGGVFTAFWYRDPESEDWRLVVGSDAVDIEGPTRVNTHLLKVLTEKHVELSPLEVDVVGRHDRLVEMLRSLRTQPMPLRAPMHVYRTLVGDRYVDDAYVYRNVQTRTVPLNAEIGTPLPLRVATEKQQRPAKDDERK